ncbi:MAG TPA: hypothetical protein VFH31_02370, partial [Pyrinomonadaceae bacterium]|nr:hypothetical protein [Pyrinomonadaceae bacterium]
DVVADLDEEDFSSAFARFSLMAGAQLEARRDHLAALAQRGITPDLYTASPCLFCLETLGKVPWRQTPASVQPENRSLPVLLSS